MDPVGFQVSDRQTLLIANRTVIVIPKDYKTGDEIEVAFAPDSEIKKKVYEK